MYEMDKFHDYVKQAKSIVAKAEREDRDLTDAESNRVKTLIKNAEGAKTDAKLAKEIDEMAGFGGSGNDGRERSSPRSWRRRSARWARRTSQQRPRSSRRSISSARRARSRASPGRASSASSRAARSRAGRCDICVRCRPIAKVPAAVVAPGGAKPVATWQLVNVDADIPTIALISPDIANVVLRDSGPDLERFLDTVLAADVYRTLDAVAFDALNAAAIAAGNAQAFATSPSVSLRKAVTQLELDGFVATHVFVHPTEHEALALATDAENLYYFGAPVEANVPRVHSMKLVSSPAADAGVAVVTAAPIAALGVLREDVELAVDSMTGFNVNGSRIRAEMRAMLAITAPNAIWSVDLTA